MFVVLGLGNPGSAYKNNRHNVGFMVLDHLAHMRKLTFTKTANALTAKRKNFMLVKPQTYMNLSGEALASLNATAEDILVVCDDIYLPFAEVRIRKAGGDGGHNGLASIMDAIGHDDFARMRIGVGQPESKDKQRDYVLEDFTAEEQPNLEKAVAFAATLIDHFIANGFGSMMNLYSKKKKSYSEAIKPSESNDQRREIKI